MYCKNLSLKDFRNYHELDLRLRPGLSIFQGENAVGKTSLLEAIYLLATTRSPRAGVEQEMVNLEAEATPELGAPAFARVEAQVERKDDEVAAEMVIVRDGDTIRRKRVKINGVARRAIDLLGRINVVLFAPEDLDLVIGSPAGRRRYLDITLSQIDHRYLRSLQEYSKVIAQRNGFLHNLRERPSTNTAAALRNQAQEREQLNLWNSELVRSGAYIVKRRRDCLHALNFKAARLHQNLTGFFTPLLENMVAPNSHDFELRYLPSFAVASDDDEAAIVAKFNAELARLRPKELARGVSLVGPHRDDFVFRVEGTDVAVYGSRGQQRTAVLALKLAEVSWMETQTGDRPILLLDDILSELDAHRRQYVLETVQTGAEQILITTTDLALFKDLEQLSKQASLYRVANNQVTPI